MEKLDRKNIWKSYVQIQNHMKNLRENIEKDEKNEKKWNIYKLIKKWPYKTKRNTV